MPTIDPITAGILAGLAVEGIKAIVAMGRPDPRLLTEPQELRREGLRRRLAADASLDSVLQEAAASVCRSLESDGPDAEELRDFLRSPSALAIVRQIYASKLTEQPNARLDSIRTELEAALNLHLRERAGQEVGTVFDMMLNSCEVVLEIALENNVLSAHEAKSVVRHRFLADELASIQRNLEFLTARKGLDISNVLEFEDKYRRQVSERHGQVMPPYVHAARKIDIDKIYVAPNFSVTPVGELREPATLDISNFCSSIHRAVLLGHPGGANRP